MLDRKDRYEPPMMQRHLEECVDFGWVPVCYDLGKKDSTYWRCEECPFKDGCD